MNPPNCALLVPCYNAERHVNRFLENIEELNLKFKEVIFYDDGSTDSTYDLLSKYNVNVVKGGKNNGPAFARNYLLNLTACKWIHFHDIDDLISKDFLIQMFSSISSLDEIDAIICDAKWIEEETGKVLFTWKYKNEGLRMDPIDYTLKNPIGGINGIYRKSALININGFDISLKVWEDSDLHVNLSVSGYKLFALEKTLVTSIRHDSSQSSDNLKIIYYRYLMLRKYISLPVNYHKTLALELNKIYHQAVIIKNKQLCKEINLLSKSLGYRLPISSRVFFNFFSIIFPPYALVTIKILILNLLSKSRQVLCEKK